MRIRIQLPKLTRILQPKYLGKVMATLILFRKKNSLVPGGADYGTLRISPRILEKIRNGPYGILWGWGETDSSVTL